MITANSKVDANAKVKIKKAAPGTMCLQRREKPIGRCFRHPGATDRREVESGEKPPSQQKEGEDNRCWSPLHDNNLAGRCRYVLQTTTSMYSKSYGTPAGQLIYILATSYSTGSGQPLAFPTLRTGAAPRPPCVRPPSVRFAGTDGRLRAPRPHPDCLGAPPKPSLSIFVLMPMYQINSHLRETIKDG
jgi:hypothetical protein